MTHRGSGPPTHRDVVTGRISVSNTPGVLDKATADVAFGLLLAAARRIVEADRFVRTHADWHWGPDVFLGRDVSAAPHWALSGWDVSDVKCQGAHSL